MCTDVGDLHLTTVIAGFVTIRAALISYDNLHSGLNLIHVAGIRNGVISGMGSRGPTLVLLLLLLVRTVELGDIVGSLDVEYCAGSYCMI